MGKGTGVNVLEMGLSISTLFKPRFVTEPRQFDS